jgi:hypothetical protein
VAANPRRRGPPGGTPGSKVVFRSNSPPRTRRSSGNDQAGGASGDEEPPPPHEASMSIARRKVRRSLAAGILPDASRDRGVPRWQRGMLGKRLCTSAGASEAHRKIAFFPPESMRIAATGACASGPLSLANICCDPTDDPLAPNRRVRRQQKYTQGPEASVRAPHLCLRHDPPRDDEQRGGSETTKASGGGGVCQVPATMLVSDGGRCLPLFSPALLTEISVSCPRAGSGRPRSEVVSGDRSPRGGESR